jgi:glycosyltransferase involved in cell wall biosynthesis
MSDRATEASSKHYSSSGSSRTSDEAMLRRPTPVRVLHLRDSPWIDGPGRTILETGTHIDPARVDFHIGVFVGEGTEHPLVIAARERGIQIHAIPDRPGIDRSAVDHIVALMEEHRIDVLHTSEFRSNVFSLLCRRRRHVKTATTVHGWIANDLRGKLYRIADKLLLRSFDAVIVVSTATRRLVSRWWLPDSRAHVLHNALVLDAYGAKARSLQRRRADPAGRVNLLNVGRLSHEKGQVLLLQALAPLMAKHEGMHLRMAGVGPLEADLRETAANLGIGSQVKFLGYVQDMAELYAETDLVIQSSLTEGLPNVILEAAYLKVPIVATVVGGTDEVIEHERSGWLIAPSSAAAIQDGVRRFLIDPDYFAAMAETAHSRICHQFSFEARTQALMDIYEGLYDET